MSHNLATLPALLLVFDIPEFVPGVPWLGANSQKVEDDPNITPGSVARSISVSTTASLNPTGRNSTDLGWGSSSKSSWPGQNLVSTSGGDMWKTGNTRPPPGFGKNMNRSMSMPQGPSEKSAFSPVGSSWDNQQALLSSVNVPWLLLRTVPALGDGNLLKTLCSQHGPLQNFFVNANNGQALVRYNTKEESSKAQKNLNSCSFGETTIMAEFVDESEVQKIVEQCQRQPSSLGRSNSVSAAPGSNVWPNTNSSASNLWGGSSSSTWSALPNSGFLPSSDISGNNFNM
ncbi:TNRC6C [Bugula neritina]|uniref:TNRC6C n=1 Tax=Bugula neritina TaxID=10212 RepID=A0A7J7J0I9_BUGNE|nr:TNRC6C [Bugula neritina]